MVYDDKRKASIYKYIEKNRDKVKEYDAQQHRDRYKTDEEYRKRKLAQMKAYREAKKAMNTSSADKQDIERSVSLLPQDTTYKTDARN